LIFGRNIGWIGVDLGTHTVKLAQAERTAEGVRLRHAAVIQRPAPWPESDGLGADEPDPSWPEIVAALECGEFHGRSAACLLPMNVCELRGLKVPQGDEAERRAMIASELADDEDERSAPIEFDYWELGGEKGIETSEGFNVNVLSIPRPWIDQVADDCQKARLDCWAIDGTPLAMARAVALAARERTSERVVAVDWGFSNTTLAIVGRGRPLYARRLHDCHFQQCLSAIEQALGVSRDHAQHLADVHGVLAPRDATPEKVFGESDTGDRELQSAITSAISDVAASLVEQVKRTTRFVESQRRHQHPTSLWLMGGGASIHNIAPYLAAQLEMPVVAWQVPADRDVNDVLQGPRSALFGPALALSALAWRAA
jgi:Tfp pilus assembly PilM family ATPase